MSPAVVFDAPGRLSVRPLALVPPADGDVSVDIAWSGISTGTERLLWEGRMPAFPGMGYPLVPGYESVGRIAGGARDGRLVFVPGARCYADARGLFGGAAARVNVPAAKAHDVPEALGEDAVLLALAATAHHALAGGAAPQLIVGHGVLGRLLARLVLALGYPAPTVWETRAERRAGASGYAVLDPRDDERRDYRDYAVILDASGDAALIDTLIARLASGGELVLAGFYEGRVGFDFAPAFMREARLRVAAEWKPGDLSAVLALVASGALSLGGLVTHRADAADAARAYPAAFGEPSCLKMILDWRGVQ